MNETNQRSSLAWHVAYLSRVEAKKFPPHDKLIIKNNAKKRFQDPEARWRSLNGAAAASSKH